MSADLAAALTKKLTGQRISQRDQRLLTRHDKAESERLLRAVPRATIRQMTGWTQAKLEQIQREHGFPVAGVTIDLHHLVPALLNFVLDSAEFGAVGDMDSPALERWRAARADMAELDRDRMRGELLPRAETRGALGQVAAVIRLAGERLELEHGPDARLILDEALDEAEAALDAAFGTEPNEGK